VTAALAEWADYVLAYKAEFVSGIATLGYVGVFLWSIRKAERREHALRREKTKAERHSAEP
jgi:hypothetical protein